MAVIVSLFYYPHGLMASIDGRGDQDATESGPWYVDYLRWLASIGRADAQTVVHVPASFRGPLAQAVAGVRDFPLAPLLDPLSAIYFNPNGETICVNMANARDGLCEAYWWQPSVEDKLRRGVIDGKTRIVVPNVYVGSLKHFLAQVPPLARPA